MLWRRSAQTPTPSLATLVPEGEAVRLSALQASWRRDRWVTKRRLAWRWMAWYVSRYGLPVLGVCAAILLARQLLWEWPAKTAIEIPEAPSATLSTKAISDAPQEPSVRLRFDPAWPDKSKSLNRDTPAPLPAASATEATIPLTPHLKPENWLHSKEP